MQPKCVDANAMDRDIGLENIAQFQIKHLIQHLYWVLNIEYKFILIKLIV